MVSKRNTAKRARAVIVADGPSAAGFEPPDDVTVIAVNGAIEWLSRADYFFTLDLSAANLQRLQRRRKDVIYCAAGMNTPLHGVERYQRVAKQGIEPANDSGPEWWLWRWSCVLGLSENKQKIHTGNSAYGALGLAYHLGIEDVALIGVDATTEERICGGRPNNLSHLPLLFASALSQINVVSCGRMAGIPQMTFEEWYG